MAGGESTTRGFLDGWDPDTGKKLWRRYTIPAPGEPGSETWPKNSDAWKHGGGPTWRSGSYDPATRPRLLGHRQRGAVRSQASRGPRQLVHVERARDPAEDRRDRLLLPVHAQRRVRRRRHRRARARRHPRSTASLRKVMIQANKNGFMYVLDRTNCKLIAAQSLRQGQLGHAHRSRHRPAGADRRLQALSRRRGGRDLAVARDERGADRVQSEHRARLRQPRGTCRASRSSRRRNQQVHRRQHHRRHRQAPADHSRATCSATSRRSIR